MSGIFTNFVSVRVIHTDGIVQNLKVNPDTSIRELKSLALIDESSEPDTYKLILVSNRQALDEDNTLSQLHFRNYDEVFLAEIPPLPPKESFQGDLRGPTLEEITEITRNLEERNHPKGVPVQEDDGDSLHEVRKILISLVEAAARLLSPSPDGMEIYHLIRERLAGIGQPAASSPSVKQLTEMGFSEDHAIKALKLNKMNLTDALGWLLQQDTDATMMSNTEQGESSSHDSTTSKAAPKTVIEAFQTLLDSARQSKWRDFIPNAKYVQNLKEMGFPEDEVTEALKITANNQDAACTWLLGDRKQSLQGLDKGLDQDNPIFRAIMANPQIQLNLTKPKTLLAFLSMIENPKSADLWSNDDDLSPIMNQIFKTYQTEKHAKQVNEDGQTAHCPESDDTDLPSQWQTHSFFGDDNEDFEDEDDDDENENDADISEFVWTP